MVEFSNEYYINTKDREPSPLLIRALSYLETGSDIALDLGSGAGCETKLLLERGFFRVTAVDSEPIAEKFINQLRPLGDLSFVCSTFEDFDYGHYDLINAHLSLPFVRPESFSTVMEKTLCALSAGAIFVGQLFGVHDDWNAPGSNMTFHTKEVEVITWRVGSCWASAEPVSQLVGQGHASPCQ